MHIYLALATDRFSSSGLKQKSFSPEWKEIYLLWIHGQDAIELMSTTGHFHPYRLCFCFPATGSLSAPQKPRSPWQPTLFLAPPVSLQRQSMHRTGPHYHSVGPTQPENPLPSWTLVWKDTVTSFCTSPRLSMFDEPPVTRRWRWGWLLQDACALVQLHWHGLVKHIPPSPAHALQNLVPSAWYCECAKALSASTVCKQASNKQKT